MSDFSGVDAKKSYYCCCSMVIIEVLVMLSNGEERWLTSHFFTHSSLNVKRIEEMMMCALQPHEENCEIGYT